MRGLAEEYERWRGGGIRKNGDSGNVGGRCRCGWARHSPRCCALLHCGSLRWRNSNARRGQRGSNRRGQAAVWSNAAHSLAGMGSTSAFCARVETGSAAPSCVIDFAYTDGGNLRGPETQLERCICFHDPDEIVTVVHVHEANVRMAQGALPPQRGREDSLRSLFTWRGLRPSSQMKSFVQDRVEQVKCAGATVSPIAGATSRDLTSIEAAITAEEAFPGALG